MRAVDPGVQTGRPDDAVPVTAWLGGFRLTGPYACIFPVTESARTWTAWAPRTSLPQPYRCYETFLTSQPRKVQPPRLRMRPKESIVSLRRDGHALFRARVGFPAASSCKSLAIGRVP